VLLFFALCYQAGPVSRVSKFRRPHSMVASWSRFAYYTVADPRVADLVMLARSLAADNAAALADCVRTAPPR
jgi:hypothetical protein